jgi:hypothetical protein
MSNMTINEVRSAKREAEEQIAAILLTLTQRTGLMPSEVRCNPHAVHLVGRSGPHTIEFDVSIRLEGL